MFVNYLKPFLFRQKLRKAFTIAEVLITLSVIGIVSALVIPTVKLKVQEHVLVSRYKQLYGMMNVAFNESVKKHGPVKFWDLEGVSDFVSVRIIKYLIPAGLNAEYVEGKLPHIVGQWLHNKNTDSVDATRWQIYKLKNGITFFQVQIAKTDCSFTHAKYNQSNVYLKNLCADFSVDLNGEAGPNTFGIDIFQFYISSRGVIPVGIKEDGLRPIEYYCNPKSTRTFNGYSCGAYILDKGKMPWLWGKEVSWDDK